MTRTRTNVLLFAGLALLLIWPFLLSAIGAETALANLDTYHSWIHAGFTDGAWPGLTVDGVYPAGALVPMGAFGWLESSTAYLVSTMGLLWLVQAVTTLAIRDHVGEKAALWFVGFLLLAGPIAISRIDVVAVNLATAALLVGVARPRLAAALVTMAAWVKVGHGAWMLPLLVVARRSWTGIVAVGAAISAVFVALALAFGSLGHLTSFVTGQTDRGLQIEGVAAIPLNVARLFGGDVTAVENTAIHTFEFRGDLATALGTACDVTLPLGVLLIGALTWRAKDRLPAGDLLVLAITATTLMLLVTNKVSTVTFMLWLASPAVASFRLPRTTSGFDWARFRATSLVVAGLSFVVCPIGYQAFIDGDIAMIVLNLIRDGVLVVLLAWALKALALSRPAGRTVRPS